MALGEYLGAGSGTTKLLSHLNGNTNDSSGNGNNGTPSNISWVSGKQGNLCASFNGSNSYINYPTVTTGTSATFSFWINKNANTDQCVFIEESYSNNSMFYYDSATSKFVYRFGSTNNLLSTANPITNSTWNLITVTHTGTTATIYINGVPNVTGTVNAKTGSGTSFTLGRLTATLYFFNGKIDEFIVENRVWSASEIKKYYTYSKGRFIG